MKQRPLNLSLIAICVIFLAGTQLFSQPIPPDHARGAMPDLMGLSKAVKLIIDLNLTPEQIVKMVTLFKDHHAAMEKLNKEKHLQTQAFHGSFDPASFDETKTKAFAASQAKLTEEIIVRRFTFGANMFSILDAEQKEKVAPMLRRLKEMRKSKSSFHRMRKPGPPMGMDDRPPMGHPEE